MQGVQNGGRGSVGIPVPDNSLRCITSRREKRLPTGFADALPVVGAGREECEASEEVCFCEEEV